MKKQRERIDVDLELIRDLMGVGVSCRKIANDSVDVKSFYRKRLKRKHEKQGGLCSICKRNPLPKGHRYFCMECFRNVESGEISPELTLHSKRGF